MEYIDPVFAIGDFDVRNDELTVEGTIGAGSSASSATAGPALSLVQRPAPLAPFGIPSWVFILGGIVFLIASSSERT